MRVDDAVRPVAEVLLDAKVLSIPNAALGPLGLSRDSGNGGPINTGSFLIPLAETEVRTLLDNPLTKTVHNLTLHGTAGNRTQFRVDTRVPGNSSAGIDTYFLLGIGLEATPTVLPNRLISLRTGSVVQIRRGPSREGVGAPLLFETPLMRHEVQIPEGMTILLGGFVSPATAPVVPDIAKVPENPILNYILPNGPKKQDDVEIVVMLTPRLVGAPSPALPSFPPPVQRVSPPPAITGSPATPTSAEPSVAVAAISAPVVKPNALIREPAVSTPWNSADLPAPAPVALPSTRMDFTPPASALPAPPVTPKPLVPASAMADATPKSIPPVPVSVKLGPSTRLELPVPATAPPAPAMKPKVLVPASVASGPAAKPDLPVPASVALAPSARLNLTTPESALPGPPPKADLPILVSAASSTTSNFLSIASAPPTQPNVPVPVSVTLAPSPKMNLPVPVAPLPAPPTPARKPNAPFHTVQVGAFRDRTRAESLMAEMEKRFGDSFMETDPASRTPYRVRVGHLADLAAARQLQRRLRTLGFDSFVVLPTSH